MENIWSRLSFYESTDLIKKFYKTKHNRTLNASKAKEIVSHFKQGRNYFESASTASDLVKPLLMYYGVVALSRGLILYLDISRRENSLKGAHGVEVVGWGNTLSDGIKNIPSLKIRTCNGTFSELVKTTRNASNIKMFTGPYPSQVELSRTGTEDILSFEVEFEEILARIPELITEYSVTFDKLPKVFPSQIFYFNSGTQIDISIFEINGQLPSKHEIREFWGLEPNIDITYRANHNFVGNVKNQCFRIRHNNIDELVDQMPFFLRDEKYNNYACVPFENKIMLSKLSLLFLSSYTLGMLVRYYPTHWNSLVSKENGDYTYPIIRALITSIETLYPKLVLESF